MTRTLTVVSAGLRSPSSTRMLADRLGEAATAELTRTGEALEVRLVEVREHAHAIADALLTGFPPPELAAALHDVTSADALVVVTPTFQGSYSGLFKSFMDLLEPGSLRGTPTVLAATGGSERHSLMIEHALRPMFAYLKATAVATSVYAATSDFGEGGAALDRRIAAAAEELADLVLEGPRTTSTRPTLEGSPSDAAGDLEITTPFGELLARAGVEI